MSDTSGLTEGDMSSLIRVKEDNTEVVEKAIAKALAAGLEKIGLAAEGYAKRLCPVDTGRLRNSITHQSDGIGAVYIGTNVEYGPHVEMGTKKVKAQPFLRPAAKDHASQYRSILKEELGGD